jgi:DNA-binding transcriptional regulator YhcF (GntR family)
MDDISKKLSDYIHIDPTSSEPLYKQLEDQLALYISACEVGKKIPSERTFAAELDLNRDTVRRALKKYIDQGVLAKYGRKGIIVEQEISMEDESENLAHPLLFMENELFNKSSIKLLLYETLPHQKKFWEDVVEVYNSSSPHNSVEIEWAPRSLKSGRLYCQYIKDHKIDMYLSSVPEWSYFKELNVRLELPEEIKTLLAGDQYLADSLHYFCPERHNFGVPVHCSVPLLSVFNPSVIERFQQGANPVENMKNIFNYAKELSADEYLLNNLNNCISSYGFPSRKDEASLREYLYELYSALFNFNSLGERLYRSKSCWWEADQATINFENNKNLFNFTFSGSLHKLLEYDQPMKIYLPQSVETNHIHSSISYLLVNKSTHDKDGCWDFATFLLGDTVQKMIAEYMINLPLNKKFSKDFFAVKQITADLGQGFDCYRVNKESGMIAHCLSTSCSNEFNELLDGRYSPDKLVENTINIIYRTR